jgi:hypothetical protein
MDTCNLQTFGNVTVMILAAIFTGIRLSRCRKIRTYCCECDREIVGSTQNSTANEATQTQTFSIANQL